jgi:hypothetical protein
MLIGAEQMKKAMELSVAEVCEALQRSGYSDLNDISEVRFKGFNGECFVYEITYPDPESEGAATGNVFISMKRRAFSSTFEFYGEF